MGPLKALERSQDTESQSALSKNEAPAKSEDTAVQKAENDTTSEKIFEKCCEDGKEFSNFCWRMTNTLKNALEHSPLENKKKRYECYLELATVAHLRIHDKRVGGRRNRGPNYLIVTAQFMKSMEEEYEVSLEKKKLEREEAEEKKGTEETEAEEKNAERMNESASEA